MATPRKDKRSVKMGKLHLLLTEAFPDRMNESGNFVSVSWLSERLGMSNEGFYKYLREDELPAKRVRQIIKIKGCTKQFEDFIDFIA